MRRRAIGVIVLALLAPATALAGARPDPPPGSTEAPLAEEGEYACDGRIVDGWFEWDSCYLVATSGPAGPRVPRWGPRHRFRVAAGRHGSTAIGLRS
jgi:hypothetical protein